MVVFMFDNVYELDEWRTSHIKQYGEIPRITAKYLGKNKIFSATVNL